jgi:adenine-specific DNA-methyltransferase
MAERQQQIAGLIFDQLPEDGSSIGTAALLERVQKAAQGRGLSVAEEEFRAAREALVASGKAAKGRGRGGSTSRVLTPDTGEPDRPEFALVVQDAPPQLPADQPAKARKAAPRPSQTQSGDPVVLSYRFPDRRANNPEVGLVNEQSDPEKPKTTWAYDPHLDPDLRFDSARAQAEAALNELVDSVAMDEVQRRDEIAAWLDHALAGGDERALREVIGNLRKKLDDPSWLKPSAVDLAEKLKRMGAPHLQWAGKAERTSFEVDTVSLHVHERIDPMSILAAVSKSSAVKATDRKGKHYGAIQPGLFEAPFESLPLRDAVDFYRHDKGWSNRLIAGDSLLVMNSLLQKESMAGRVQMIYIDPPYGIKYGSNFQPFTNRRDVKDRADSDLTQEPEMIKAFRDTWELGIHSYLTYLRDRLLLAKELLGEAGSVFVQISDENAHLVRNLMDEIFHRENFCSQIVFRKTTGKASELVDATCDFVIWYAKDRKKVKFQPIYEARSPQDDYNLRMVELPDRTVRALTPAEVDGREHLPLGARVFRHNPITSARPPTSNDLREVEFRGRTFSSGSRTFSTDATGMSRLAKAGRLTVSGNTLGFIRYLNDFPYKPGNDIWDDTRQSGFADTKVYVVQTATRAIERCMLMTTEPGDLVLDPTCGSGTTAFVAEKLGRRWITCDTSRVAVTLAKTRLMTSSFDYFELRYPSEGLKGGFIYRTVPHITLKSIANNPEVDSIYERLHPAVLAALDALNKTLGGQAAPLQYVSPEGVRKGTRLNLHQGDVLHEWEVPLAFPPEWPPSARRALEEFHTARQRMLAEMDRSVAAHAGSETLVDQPERARNKLRITGPFSVEAVPFPTVLNLHEGAATTQSEFTADAAVARSGATNRHAQWRDELMKTGIRGKGGQMLKFTSLDTLAGTTCLHCSGTLDTGEPAVLSFGPEHGALEQRQVEHAIGEAGELFPRPKMIVFCAFTFDPEAAKDIDAFKGITALKVQMNTDLLTEDLKKARSSNQSFWLMGQPDVLLRKGKDGLWQVEVNGFDYFDTIKGDLVSGGKSRIAMWSLDIDYDGRSLFPHQVFFPMAGKGEGWDKLRKDIRAELDEDKLKAFQGTVSLPFAAGSHGRVAVKIVDDRGIESLKVLPLSDGAGA